MCIFKLTFEDYWSLLLTQILVPQTQPHPHSKSATRPCAAKGHNALQVTSQIYLLIIEAMFNTKVKRTTAIPKGAQVARLHILVLMFFFCNRKNVGP